VNNRDDPSTPWKSLTQRTTGLFRVKRWGTVLLVLFWTGLALVTFTSLTNWPSTEVAEALSEDWFIAIVVALVYLQVLLVARWLLIANPYRTSLGAEIETLRGRLKATSPAPDGTTIKQAWRIEAERLLDEADDRLAEPDPFFWSWGDQKAAAQMIAAAEILAASALSPTEAKYRLDVVTAEIARYAKVDSQVPTVLQKLQTALQQVERDRIPPGVVAEGAHKEVGSTGDGATDGADSSDYQILHANALEVLHRLEVAEFARILKWHRKVLWITVSGLILLVLLVASLGNGALLLVGAAGAYLSRLTRIIRRADAQPEDISSYWTNLLLGPLLGALAAYGGILLVDLLNEFDLIGGKLSDVSFAYGSDERLNVLTIALAFLFGFTEGLVNRIASGVDTALTGRPDPSEISASSSKSSP
jgi:hypothetical protein